MSEPKSSAGRPRKPTDPKFPKRAASQDTAAAAEMARETPQGYEIGLSADLPADRPAEPESDTAYCMACGHDDIAWGSNPCPNCGRTLQWPD